MAPTPSATMSKPNVDAPPPRTSIANSVPSGMITPPPISPPPSPIITPRTSALERMNFRPSQMSCVVSAIGIFLTAPRLLSGSARREIKNAETRNVDASTRIGRSGCCVPKRCKCSKPPSHFDTPARIEKKIAPSGNVPKAANTPSELADVQLIGIRDDVRDRRVLRRAPQQREDFDEERQHDEAEHAVPERQQHDQHTAADVARHHHRLAVPAVNERAADRREEDARHHARGHHETDGEPRVRRFPGNGDDREKAGPVAEARDKLRTDERQESGHAKDAPRIRRYRRLVWSGGNERRLRLFVQIAHAPDSLGAILVVGG